MLFAEAPKPRTSAEIKKTSVQGQKAKKVTESSKAQKRPADKLESLKQGSKQPRLSEKEGSEKKSAGPSNKLPSSSSEKRRPSTTEDKSELDSITFIIKQFWKVMMKYVF